jgi:hypothetical protein
MSGFRYFYIWAAVSGIGKAAGNRASIFGKVEPLVDADSRRWKSKSKSKSPKKPTRKGAFGGV